jgi:GcrA cell cycle regulator
MKSGELQVMSWTDERIELLKKLWADGLSASQIAAELGGVTRNAVIGKVHRLGLSGRAKSTGSAPPRPRKQASRPAPVRAPQGGGSYSVRGNVALKPIMHAESAIMAVAEQQAEDVVVPMSRRVSIMELREGVCKWPMGDPMAVDFVYCGADAPSGDVYCSCHARVAYQPTQDRRRAAPRV